MHRRLDKTEIEDCVRFRAHGVCVAAQHRGRWRDEIAPNHLYLVMNLSNASLTVFAEGFDLVDGRSPPRTLCHVSTRPKRYTVGGECDGPILRLTVPCSFLLRYETLVGLVDAGPARLHVTDATILALGDRLRARLVEMGPQDLRVESEADNFTGVGEIEAFVVVVLSGLADCSHGDDRQSQDWPVCVHAAIELMDGRLDHALSLPDIASHVGVSQYHFARLFRQAVGVSVHQYIIARRVERAAHLIEATSAPLAEVAHEVGFGSQSHMTSVMRKTLGRTPGDLRRSVRHGRADRCGEDRMSIEG